MSNEVPNSITGLYDAMLQEIGFVVVGLSGLFVIMMQAGFALFESGISRSRNVYTVLVRTYLIFFEVCILYWSVGHAFAYSTGNLYLGYRTHWFGLNMFSGDYSKWIFGMSVCATTVNVIATSLIERVRFQAFFVFTFFSVAFFQPIVIHWAWHRDGWLLNTLNGLAYQDFAGSGVLHVYAGVIGLMGCIVLKPRISRFNDDPYLRSPKQFNGHSKPLMFLGGFLVLMGFMSLRVMAVYQHHGTQRFITGLMVIVNTLITCSFSALTASLVTALFDYYSLCCFKVNGRHDWWKLFVGINAAISGMASSAAGCDIYYTWAACVNGVIGGCVYFTWSLLMRSCKIDDPLDVTAVHLSCGVWGLMSAPLFSMSGFIYNPGPAALTLFAWNLAGAGSIMLWSGLPFLLLFIVMRYMGIFRISVDTEAQGLDTFHQEVAYNYFHAAQDNTGNGDNVSDLTSLNSFKRYESLRSRHSNRRRPSIQWNIPEVTSKRASIRRSVTPYYRRPASPPNFDSVRDSHVSDWQNPNNFLPFNQSSAPGPYWWEDRTTGRRYYGERPLEWGSCPNLSYNDEQLSSRIN